jgi:hypothetical protein
MHNVEIFVKVSSTNPIPVLTEKDQPRQALHYATQSGLTGNLLITAFEAPLRDV